MGGREGFRGHYIRTADSASAAAAPPAPNVPITLETLKWGSGAVEAWSNTVTDQALKRVAAPCMSRRKLLRALREAMSVPEWGQREGGGGGSSLFSLSVVEANVRRRW